MHANQICPVIPDTDDVGIDPLSLPLSNSVLFTGLRHNVRWYIFHDEEHVQSIVGTFTLIRFDRIGHNYHIGDAFNPEFGLVCCKDICSSRADRGAWR